MQLVSVVIPCYNDEAGYLRDCLSSLIAQVQQEWEAIVVDDGSSRGDSAQIVKGFGDARIRFVRHQSNRGPAAARNTGVRLSNFDLIAMVDCDDRLAPDFLKALSEPLERYAECGAAYSDFQFFGARCGPLRFVAGDKDLTSRPYKLRHLLEAYFPGPPAVKTARLFWGSDPDHLERSLLMRFLLPPGPGTMFRKALLEQVGGYCEVKLLSGLEDWDLWLTAADRDASVVCVPRELYYYRQHSLSLSTCVAGREHAIRELMYERHAGLFDRLKLRRSFLAAGYRRSARAAWRVKDHPKAVRLAVLALLLSPGEFLCAAFAKHATGEQSPLPNRQ